MTTIQNALAAHNPSVRLQAALAAGTQPSDGFPEALVARCAVEPDFYVRDMLTWALTRHESSVVVPLLLDELRSPVAQARSQALHTLSKIGEGWSAITDELLRDPDDDVARSAWRAAAVLVPVKREAGLAAALTTQLGRGDRDVRMSLSRALSGLGEAAEAALATSVLHVDPEVRLHAVATLRLVHNPDESFDASVFEAQRVIALKDAPGAEGVAC